MIGNAKAVGFVADTLEQVEALRTARQDNRLAGAGNVDLFGGGELAV